MSLVVSNKLPSAFETPAVRDPIVRSLCTCISSSPKLVDMIGSSIITTKFVLLSVSLMTGLVIMEGTRIF